MASWTDKIVSYRTGQENSLVREMMSHAGSYLPASKNIFANFERKDLYQSEIAAREKALGSLHSGYIPLNSNGEKMENTGYYDSNVGKWVYTDSEGKVIVTNEDRMKESRQLWLKTQRMIDDITSYAIINNRQCADLLGLKMDDLKGYLMTGKDIIIEGDGLDEDVVKVNGMPSSLASTGPGSQLYLNKLAKIRRLVELRLPYINLVSFRKTADDDKNIRNPVGVGEEEIARANAYPITDSDIAGIALAKATTKKEE